MENNKKQIYNIKATQNTQDYVFCYNQNGLVKYLKPYAGGGGGGTYTFTYPLISDSNNNVVLAELNAIAGYNSDGYPYLGDLNGNRYFQVIQYSDEKILRCLDSNGSEILRLTPEKTQLSIDSGNKELIFQMNESMSGTPHLFDICGYNNTIGGFVCDFDGRKEVYPYQYNVGLRNANCEVSFRTTINFKSANLNNFYAKANQKGFPLNGKVLGSDGNGYQAYRLINLGSNNAGGISYFNQNGDYLETPINTVDSDFDIEED